MPLIKCLVACLHDTKCDAVTVDWVHRQSWPKPSQMAWYGNRVQCHLRGGIDLSHCVEDNATLASHSTITTAGHLKSDDARPASGDPLNLDDVAAGATMADVVHTAAVHGAVPRVEATIQRSSSTALTPPNCGAHNCTACGIAEGYDTCPGKHNGESSPGRESHSDTTLYISLVILHTKYTGWCENDFNVHA
jgi:hypothetical protein